MDELLNTEMHLNDAEAKLSKLGDSMNPVRHLLGGWMVHIMFAPRFVFIIAGGCGFAFTSQRLWTELKAGTSFSGSGQACSCYSWVRSSMCLVALTLISSAWYSRVC